MSPQCFCRVWAIYSFVIFHDVRLSCNMSVFKKASFRRLFSLLITIVIFLYKIRFFGVPPAAASEEKEKLGTPQTPAKDCVLCTPAFLSHGDFVKRRRRN